MSYTTDRPTGECTICAAVANLHRFDGPVATVVDCSRCGDFEVDRVAVEDYRLPFTDPKRAALASYNIRKMQGRRRPLLTSDFFDSLSARRLPTPVEAGDNLILWLAEQADERPGTKIEIAHANPSLLGAIGVVGPDDVDWIVENLSAGGLFSGRRGLTVDDVHNGGLTGAGWQRFEELKQAQVASNFAFFARKFINPDLDKAFEQCLRPAVAETGYELRTVTQRAGLVDATIEDEIRRCKFLIADLSDDNAGAYWEAGFAEGLGKPVIYVCRAKDGDAEKRTHFDANHRHTVRWDLAMLDETARQLKAVIRNTLLGDARQPEN